MSAELATGPTTCTIWCFDGKGHGGAMFVADQHCDAETIDLPVSLEPRWLYRDRIGIAHSMVLARREVGEHAHVVWVSPEDHETRMTPAEARQHAAALMVMAALAESAT